MNIHRLPSIEQLKELTLPLGEWVLVGSAALGVRGIRPSADIDVLVTLALWEKLEKLDIFSHIEKISIDGTGYICLERDNIEIICSHPFDSIDTDEVITQAELVDGIPIMSLDMLCTLKQQQGREKDLKDVQLIQEYLDAGGT